ncbi:30S ribosome-binding factor RbfA [Candidatus Acetothermia bacterium]|nr:30S ribosome-binding factor RbfA [Candidatus Acetothermia bacterium]
MNDSHTLSRIQNEIKRALSDILEFEVRDKAIKDTLPTVMAVKLTRDARNAKVYISVIKGANNQRAVVSLFQAKKGFFRSMLAQRIALRYVPELHFVLDETVERSLRMEEIFRQDRE